MTQLTHILDSLGWALLHSLWQGALACILVLLFRAGAGKLSAQMRFTVQYSVLLSVLFAFIAAFTFYLNIGASIPGLPGGANDAVLESGGVAQIFMSSPQFNVATDAAPITISITPMIGIIWCLGFAFMALRYLAGFAAVQRLQRVGLSDAPAQWTARFERLVSRMGAPIKTRLKISALVEHPVALGFIRPVVLIPAGLLTALPADQVEAILLHELGHIRRQDYILNLIQVAIKSIFFFHPGVHLICRFLEDDREIACDDLAVAQSGSPKPLAQALAGLRAARSAPDFAMAHCGEGSQLLSRIRRLAGLKPGRKRQDKALSALIAATMISALCVVSLSPATAQNLEEVIESQIKVDVPKVKVEFNHPNKGKYHFDYVQVSDRMVTVKVLEDGSRWINTSQGWIDVDKSPESVDLLPVGAPVPPEPPKYFSMEKIASDYPHKAEKFIAKDKKVMAQFETDLNYFEAATENYCSSTSDPVHKAEIRAMEARAQRAEMIAEDEFEDRQEKLWEIKEKSRYKKS